MDERMEFIDPEFRISRQHGSWVKIDGIWRTALYHPSALLRDPSKRPETFRDLKSLKQMVLDHCPNTVLED
jgi:DNA polymerase